LPGAQQNARTWGLAAWDFYKDIAMAMTDGFPDPEPPFMNIKISPLTGFSFESNMEPNDAFLMLHRIADAIMRNQLKNNYVPKSLVVDPGLTKPA